jgi:PAS domain S-box-containing protein
MEMLTLDFLYARVIVQADEKPLELLRAGPSHRTDEIAQSLDDWLNEDQIDRSSQTRYKIADREISIFPMRMGAEGNFGFIVAGSRRLGFPEQTERLVLSVAADQTAAALQHALLLSEQKRVASELDRRVAERTRELAETNEALQLQVGLLQHLPVSAWTLNPDGTPDFVNQVWLEYSGQTLDFVRSRPDAWITAVHPEDREAAAKSFWEGVHSGQGFAFETRSLRAHDGTYRWHLQQAVVLRDTEGKVLKFVGTTTDIDDQKRAEEELRASENNLRQFLDSIPALVLTLSAAGEIELFNPQVLDYFGKTAEDLRAWASGNFIHPDDMPRAIAAFTHSIATATPYYVEERCRRADGVYRWFRSEALPVRDAGGNVVGWSVLMTDIDDRKRAQEKLRRSEALLAQVQSVSLTGGFSWRVDTDDFTFSEEAYRVFEFEKDAPVTLQQIASRVHPEDIPLFSERIAGARSAGDNLDYEIRLRMPDGSVKYLHTISHEIRDPQGRLEVIGAAQDITRRRLSEEALNKARSELAHVSRVTSLGALAASIAHEVNQPLSGIITNASTCLRMLAADPPQVEGARETARRTIRDGNRMSEVIARLRALFSKKEAATESVNLNDAVLEVIALSIVELQKNRVTLRPELADNLPLVTGDRVQLQQVILNLLRNGSDAMSTVENRPRHLVIRTERDDGDRVRLTVQDAGIGFDPQAVDRLFDAFYTTKGDGMGIGLSVSRSIIERHHGRLWATLNDGPGAAFSFSIPRASEGLARAHGIRNIQAPAVPGPAAA